MCTITWDNENQALQMINQRLVPGVFRIDTYNGPGEIAEAIRTMVVRSALAIGDVRPPFQESIQTLMQNERNA